MPRCRFEKKQCFIHLLKALFGSSKQCSIDVGKLAIWLGKI